MGAGAAFKILQNESCLLQGCTIQHGTGYSPEELQSQHRLKSGKTPDKTTVVAPTITAKLSTLILPASFNLIVPIFKGRPAEEIEVEIIADVDGRNIRLSLCSPGAEVIVEEERNKAIDEQLLLIRKLAPDIAIIEQ